MEWKIEIMRIFYYDCFSGISGDMNVGALIDVGVDKDYLISELPKLNIDGYEINIKKYVKKDFKVIKIGYGIGSKDNDDISNVLRVFIGETIPHEKNSYKDCYWNKDGKTEYILDRRNMDKCSFRDESGYIRDQAQVIECNIDDMNPEKYQYIIDKLI